MKKLNILLNIFLISLFIGISGLHTACAKIQDPTEEDTTVELQTTKTTLETIEPVTINVVTTGPTIITTNWRIASGEGSLKNMSGLSAQFTSSGNIGNAVIEATVTTTEKTYTLTLLFTITNRDTVSPDTPKSFSTTPKDREVELSWTANTESDLGGYKILYTLTQGQDYSVIEVGKTTTHYTLGNLTNLQRYCFILVAFDTAYQKNTSTPTSENCVTPMDGGAPSTPSNFYIQVASDGSSATLRWTNPSSPDFTGIRILRQEGGYPSNANSQTATVIYDNNSSPAQSVTDTTIIKGRIYYYAIYAYDEITPPNYSAPSQKTAIIPL